MPRALAASDVFHAIDDSNRRRLLDVLRGVDEQTVGSMVEQIGLSYSAVSQHLAVLLEVGLVARRAEGRERLYRLTPEPLQAVHDWTATYEAFWRSRLTRLHDY